MKVQEKNKDYVKNMVKQPSQNKYKWPPNV